MKDLKLLFENWRKFLYDDSVIVEISEKAVEQSYQDALTFVNKMVKTEKSAIYCLDLLIKNLSTYTKYLEIPESKDPDFLGFKLKNDILHSKESELTDDNVRSLITFTCQCLEVLLDKMPDLKTQKDILALKQKIEKERFENGTV